MKRITACFTTIVCTWAVVIATTTTISAQVWKHAVSFGGVGFDAGAAVKINQNGDRFVTGSFSDTVHIGTDTLVSAGDTDAFLGKYGHWGIQIGGSEHDEGSDIAFDAGGNIYLTGWFTDSAIFHSTDGSQVRVRGNGETIFLAKYSPFGILTWVQTGGIGSFAVNRGDSVAIDVARSAVYLTGVSQGTTFFSSSSGIVNSVPGPGTWHMYLVKYDLNGNFQWGEWNEAAPNSVPNRVAVDPDGNVYATGWFEQQVTFHSKDGKDQTISGLSEPVSTPPDYPDDSFVVSYDSSGDLRWVNDIGGYKAIMSDIIVSSSGQISVAGVIGNLNGTAQQMSTIVTSQLPGSDINLGGGHLTSPYNRDIVVATYDSAGVALSALRIGGTGQEEAGGITAVGSDLYTSGLIENTSDLFIAKVTGGALDWIKSAGGSVVGSLVQAPRLTFNPQGTIVATGAFLDTATFGPFSLHSQGAEDVFVVDLAVPEN